MDDKRYDMVKVWECAEALNSRLVGPNCPGSDFAGKGEGRDHAGADPQGGFDRDCVASGTLTYEAVYQLTQRGIGQSTAIGIGGDPIIGTTHVDALKLLNEDPETEAIILIGEIGGTAEETAAAYVKAACEEAGGGIHRGTDSSPRTQDGPRGGNHLGRRGDGCGEDEGDDGGGDSCGGDAGGIGETVARVIGK